MKGFELYAFCLLPDHVHLIVRPKGNENISKIMQFLKRNFSRDANNILGYYKTNAIGELRLRGMEGHNRNKDNSEEAISQTCYEENNLKEAIPQSRVRDFYEFITILNNLKDNHEININLPKFQWQKSYHDHVIRDEKDFENHYNYTVYNFIKHRLSQNYKYTSLNYQNIIDL